MLQNKYVIGKIGFDTAENESPKVILFYVDIPQISKPK